MEIRKPNHWNGSLKLALAAYLLLTSLAFGVAGLMSRDRYHLDHRQTVTYYLGDEAQMAYPKLYSQLIQVTHVHSFTLPLVFIVLWTVFSVLPISSIYKKSFILLGTLSILIYNIAPYILRYATPKGVWLFTLGGVGLFISYLVPVGIILYELVWGFSEANAKS